MSKQFVNFTQNYFYKRRSNQFTKCEAFTEAQQQEFEGKNNLRKEKAYKSADPKDMKLREKQELLIKEILAKY